MKPTPDGRASARAIGRHIGAAFLATLVLLNAAVAVLGAQPNQLLNGNVQPGNGTTSTSFVFTVRYRSTNENEPTSVRAVAGSVVIPLSLLDGQPYDGRYRGSARLPVGIWAVVFQATAQGNDPILAGPTVIVTPAPPPTASPQPTARPTARPTAPPTSAPTAPPTGAPTPPPQTPPLAPQTTAPTTPDPATAGPTGRPSTATAVPSARETDMGSVAVATATATPVASEDPLAAALTDPERQLVTILTGGLIAIGALAMIGFFAILRRRRRSDTDVRLALLPGAAAELPRPATTFGRPPRATVSWERDFAVDQEPIGTIEYRPYAPDETERG